MKMLEFINTYSGVLSVAVFFSYSYYHFGLCDFYL